MLLLPTLLSAGFSLPTASRRDAVIVLAAALQLRSAPSAAKYGEFARSEGTQNGAAGDPSRECLFAMPGTGVCTVYRSEGPTLYDAADQAKALAKLLSAASALDGLGALIDGAKWTAIGQSLGASRDLREAVSFLTANSCAPGPLRSRLLAPPCARSFRPTRRLPCVPAARAGRMPPPRRRGSSATSTACSLPRRRRTLPSRANSSRTMPTTCPPCSRSSPSERRVAQAAHECRPRTHGVSVHRSIARVSRSPLARGPPATAEDVARLSALEIRENAMPLVALLRETCTVTKVSDVTPHYGLRESFPLRDGRVIPDPSVVSK